MKCTQDCFNCPHPDCILSCSEVAAADRSVTTLKPKGKYTDKHRAYYLDHRKEAYARTSAYRKEHPEESRASCRKYYQAHREKILARKREQYAAKRAAVKAAELAEADRNLENGMAVTL